MDANGNVSQYEYDGFDRLAKFLLPFKGRVCDATNLCTTANPSFPDGSDFETYEYDNNGQMVWKQTRRGDWIGSQYDALGRVIGKTTRQASKTGTIETDVVYDYDKADRQTDVRFADAGHYVSHSYNNAGQLIATNDNGRSLSYAYADKVNRTRVQWPDSYSADYAYDVMNRVDTIRENDTALLADYDYDPSGRRASISLGNGTITSYSYHEDDALMTLSHNVTGAADDVDWTYGFNKINQLTDKTISNNIYQWQPLDSKTDTYVSNGLNQYDSVAGASLSYDDSGNLTSDGVWNFVYDVENMLLNASKPGVSASYLYDPLGRRSAKTVDTILTTFLHDGVEEIADYTASGTLLRRYVHGPGVDEYLVMYTGSGTGSKSYFHANHQGSIVAMSDGAIGPTEGDVTEQHSYDSYGNSDDLTGNPFRYTGRRLDEETGLYYYRARYYSPAIGRFLQTDPIGYGDGLNWYAYVGNDPVNRTDPTGLEDHVCKGETTQSGCTDPVEKYPRYECGYYCPPDRSSKGDGNKDPMDFSDLLPTPMGKNSQLKDGISGRLDSLGDSKLDKAVESGVSLLGKIMNMWDETNDQYANTDVGMIVTHDYKFGNPSKHVLEGSMLATGYQGRVSLPDNMRAVIIGISRGTAKDFLHPSNMASFQRYTNRYNVPVVMFMKNFSQIPGVVVFQPNLAPSMLE